MHVPFRRNRRAIGHSIQSIKVEDVVGPVVAVAGVIGAVALVMAGNKQAERERNRPTSTERWITQPHMRGTWRNGVTGKLDPQDWDRIRADVDARDKKYKYKG